MGQNNSQVSGNSFDATVYFINPGSADFNKSLTVADTNSGATLVMTNFKWGLGGNTVLVTGTFTNWIDHVPLYRDGPVWSRTIELERGMHYYKFVVDDEWRFNPEDPSKPDEQGNINNYIDTTDYKAISSNVESETTMSRQAELQEEGQANQTKPFITIQQFSHQAPILPNQFQRCHFLDIREHREKKQTSTEAGQMEIEGENQVEDILHKLNKEELTEVFDSCHSLEAPVHVVLNHVRIKDHKKFNVYSISHRFKSKYTTYKLFIHKKQ